MGLRTKMVMAMVTSAAGAAMLAGGTFAYFNSTATNGGNTFSAGTLKLATSLDGASTGFANGQFDVANAKPGDTFDEKYKLSNTGTLDFGSLTATVSYTASLGSDAPGVDYTGEGDDLGTQLMIDRVLVGGHDVTSYVKGNQSTLSLADIKGKTLNFGTYGQVPAGHDTTVEIQGHFLNSNQPQNHFQGASLAANVTFVASQKTDTNVQGLQNGQGGSGQGGQGSSQTTGYEVDGTMVDSQGTPFFTPVYLADSTGKTYHSNDFNATTGTFDWTNIPDGTYTVKFGMPEYTLSQPIQVVVSGHNVSSVPIRTMQQVYNVTGTATLNGQPLAHENITVQDPTGYYGGYFGADETDGSGNFTLHGLPNGTYTILIGVVWGQGPLNPDTAKAKATVTVKDGNAETSSFSH